MVNSLHAGHIEVAVAMLFNYRQNLIVPNVFWGWDLRHEADLIVVSRSGYATEIEIKISKSDLVKDFRKGHRHYSPKISRLYYAVPESLIETVKELAPATAGIISVSPKKKACFVRRAKALPGRRVITENERMKLLELAAMRIWSLKHHNNR
jgi:hypothetical protein